MSQSFDADDNETLLATVAAVAAMSERLARVEQLLRWQFGDQCLGGAARPADPEEPARTTRVIGSFGTGFRGVGQ
jgi:hypothetical protein